MREADLGRDKVLSARLRARLKIPSGSFSRDTHPMALCANVRTGLDGKCVSGCVREKTTSALELGQVVLQGTEATGHKCCCYSCFVWSFSFIRVAFLLSQDRIRHQGLEPGSPCSLLSPKENNLLVPFSKSLTRGLSHP